MFCELYRNTKEADQRRDCLVICYDPRIHELRAYEACLVLVGRRSRSCGCPVSDPSLPYARIAWRYQSHHSHKPRSGSPCSCHHCGCTASGTTDKETGHAESRTGMNAINVDTDEKVG